MAFKEGSIVRIRKDAKSMEGFVPYMRKYLGKSTVITLAEERKLHDSPTWRYRIDLDDGNWWWYPEMLLDPEEETYEGKKPKREVEPPLELLRYVRYGSEYNGEKDQAYEDLKKFFKTSSANKAFDQFCKDWGWNKKTSSQRNGSRKKRALLVSLHPQWMKAILNGEKDFEFRNWEIPSETVLYFYCTKRGPYLYFENSGLTDNDRHYYLSDSDASNSQGNPLNGKVVARAVVEEAYDTSLFDFRMKVYRGEICEILKYDGLDAYGDERELFIHIADGNQGYTDQRYAMKLKDIERIRPRELTSFTKTNGERLEYAPQLKVWVKEKE